MKAYRKIFTAFLLSMGLVSLASCNEKPVETTTSPETVVPPTIVPSEPEKADPNLTYTDITGKLKLDRDFSGKDFFKDGIQEATLNKVRDGDTAEFTLKGTYKPVTIRFFCVDTPESTGSIDKWGKSASKMTSDALLNASQIVLEASKAPAEKDSYGQRYLGYIWYKPTADADWLNLNLQLVENGYSRNFCIRGDSTYKYLTYFEEAEAFAMKNELHIHGDAEDPYFSLEATKTNLKELNENIDQFWNDEQQTGTKVQFNAYLSDLEIYDNKYTYVCSQVVDGKIYNFNIFAGYSNNPPARYLRRGNLYKFIGNVQKFAGRYQISGLVVDPYDEELEDNCLVITEGYYLTFSENLEYSREWGVSLYNPAEVTAAVIEGNNIKLTVSSVRKQKHLEAAEEFTVLIPNTNNTTSVDNLVGKKAIFKGYQETPGTIKVLKYSDIEFK